MSIADIRKEYKLGGLDRGDLAADPITQFQVWFDQARGARASGRWRGFFIRLYKSLLMGIGTDPMDINAMTLATVDGEGRPSARVVLLKGVDARGFTFFTNYASRKGRELAGNPNAALVFYWGDQEREVTVAGEVAKLPEVEADAYFRSRPLGSRIGAWASRQSEVAADRRALEAAWAEREREFAGREVPRPAHWGGYVLDPSRVEFWQGRPNRLHDRFRYLRRPEGWVVERLFP